MMPALQEVALAARPLAYVDTVFSGLLPCRVIGAAWEGEELRLRVQYTATRGAYKSGAKELWPIARVVPRSAVSFRRYLTTIRLYAWVQYLPELAGADKRRGFPALAR